MGWGAMQLGKTAKGRKKDDCRRARPREMGASEAPGVSEIIKGDEGFAIKGGARRCKMMQTQWCGGESTFSQKQQRTSKLHSYRNIQG